MPVRQLRPLLPVYLVAGLGLVILAACSSSSTTTTTVTHPTMIEVSPDNFLGNVPCSDGPGLKRYVATLFDTNYVAQAGAGAVEAESDGSQGGAGPDFQLPSSAPTPCLAAVGFGLVVAGRHYDVSIDGYDTDDLEPRASGSRQMVSPAPSEAQPVTPLATPHWTAHCRDAIALDSQIVRADHCTSFGVADEGAPASVRVPLGSLLGGLDCGTVQGQVDHFEVSLDVGQGAPLTQTVPCDPTAQAVFANLIPRSRASAYVAAFSADGIDAFAGATCDAFTRADASVDAECAGLSLVGTLRVDLQAALAQLGLICDESSISAITVGIPNQDDERISPPDCRQPFAHAFGPGPAGVSVIAIDASGAEHSLTCGATVLPGQLVLAECEKN